MTSLERSSLDRALLERLMAAMAAGDQAALFPFIEEFGDRLAGRVRSILGSLHRRDLARDDAEVDYLVQTAALVLFKRAPGWDPHGGALPWNWADRAIRAAIVEAVGHPSVELDDGAIDVRVPDPVTTEAADADFETLACSYPLIELLVEAVREVASERDADVHLRYREQLALDDTQSSHTVGAMFELNPDNVRQIDRRVRKKLSALRRSDPTFAGLVDVPWVEAS